jgi:hypothetical protein
VARVQQASIGVLMGRAEDDPEIGSEHEAFEQTPSPAMNSRRRIFDPSR